MNNNPSNVTASDNWVYVEDGSASQWISKEPNKLDGNSLTRQDHAKLLKGAAPTSVMKLARTCRAVAYSKLTGAEIERLKEFLERLKLTSLEFFSLPWKVDFLGGYPDLKGALRAKWRIIFARLLHEDSWMDAILKTFNWSKECLWNKLIETFPHFKRIPKQRIRRVLNEMPKKMATKEDRERLPLPTVADGYAVVDHHSQGSTSTLSTVSSKSSGSSRNYAVRHLMVGLMDQVNAINAGFDAALAGDDAAFDRAMAGARAARDNYALHVMQDPHRRLHHKVKQALGKKHAADPNPYETPKKKLKYTTNVQGKRVAYQPDASGVTEEENRAFAEMPSEGSKYGEEEEDDRKPAAVNRVMNRAPDNEANETMDEMIGSPIIVLQHSPRTANAGSFAAESAYDSDADTIDNEDTEALFQAHFNRPFSPEV